MAVGVQARQMACASIPTTAAARVALATSRLACRSPSSSTTQRAQCIVPLYSPHVAAASAWLSECARLCHCGVCCSPCHGLRSGASARLRRCLDAASTQHAWGVLVMLAVSARRVRDRSTCRPSLSQLDVVQLSVYAPPINTHTHTHTHTHGVRVCGGTAPALSSLLPCWASCPPASSPTTTTTITTTHTHTSAHHTPPRPHAHARTYARTHLCATFV